MKKLITMIGAAAAAFGLYAETVDLVSSAISAEAGEFYEEGTSVLTQDGWYMAESAADAAVVKAYGEETPPSHTALYAASSPEIQTQARYIGLDAEAPVYRTFAPINGQGTMDEVAIETAERGGIIADQLVKFSAFEADTTVKLDDGAKIAVWLKTLTEGDAEEDNTYALMVTCGKLDENYEPGTAAETVQLDLGNKVLKPDEWHQLKITAIKALTIDQYAVAGFKVEVDGVLAKAVAESDSLFPSGYNTYATDEAKTLIQNGELFPSFVKYDNTYAMLLRGIAFKGTGSIDDITVAAKEPYASSKTINVTLAEGVTISAVSEGSFAGNAWTFPIGTKAGTITLVAPNGKLFSNGQGTITIDVNDLTGNTIDLSKNTVEDAKAQIGSVLYLTLNAAFEAVKDGDELKLLDNVALDAYIEIHKTITFDLGGKTLASAKGVFDVYAKDVVIKNGSITAAEGCGVWVNPNGSATIASDVTITVADTAAANRAGVVVQGAASATVNGTIVQNGKGSAIAGLGNAGDAGSTIAVGATASLTSAGPGIYFPVTGGTLTIADGAAISAAETAVEIKAGTVNIGAATIATTADSATEAKNNGGNSTTGYALAIVENNAYGDNIELTVVAGAKFTGKVGIVKDDEDAPAPKSIAIANGALFTDKVGAATLIDAETQQMAKVAEAGFYAVEAKTGGDIPTDPAKDITDDTKPSDIGLDPDGPFKDAKRAELIKLSTWANKAGVKAGAINDNMTFGVGGAPVSVMAEAYLLDCTPAQLTEAKAAFKFNAADLAAAMAGTVNPATFADKSYNGTIVIKAFSDVACETPAADGAAAKFYKAFLVK